MSVPLSEICNFMFLFNFLTVAFYPSYCSQLFSIMDITDWEIKCYKPPTRRELERWCRKHVRREVSVGDLIAISEEDRYKHWSYLKYMFTKKIEFETMIYDETTENFLTPFMVACMYGLQDMIQELTFNQTCLLNRTCGLINQTAAHCILYGGNVISDNILNIPGIDWNIEDINGVTPLRFAVLSQQIENVEILIRSGKIDWRKHHKDETSSVIQIMRWFGEDDFKNRDEYLMFKHSAVRLMKILVKIPEIDWNRVLDKTGFNLLACAATFKESEELFEVLGDIPDLDWNHQTDNNLNILMIAFHYQNYSCLRKLFSMPNIDYEASRRLILHQIKFDLVEDRILFRRTILQCIKMCVQENKKTGINYSDAVDFLKSIFNEIK